jgi:antitoxin component HigA of HigAB toxin-antitoxin module
MAKACSDKVHGISGDERRLAVSALEFGSVSPSRRAGSQRSNLRVILRGERRLTLAHVRTLAKRFRVSADLFLP